MIAWRLDHHEDRISALESRPHLPDIEWSRLIPALIAIGLFLAGIISKQELAAKLLGG